MAEKQTDLLSKHKKNGHFYKFKITVVPAQAGT